jgi:NADH-quinone oxidoreductase subunit L
MVTLSTMPTPALLLLIATLLPLVGFGVLLFMGRRMGHPIAGVVGTLFCAGSLALSLGAMLAWLNTPDGAGYGYGVGPIHLPFNWLPIEAGAAGANWLQLGLYIDSLTVAMFNMITLVATLIFVFSIGYMEEDPLFGRFFTYLCLFCFSMLGLVIGGTLLQLFVFWELVGLCSYLLIGFWYQKKSASNAAIKAFVTNRIGDVGFLIGLGILFFYVGNVTLPDLWLTLGSAGLGEAVTLSNGVVLSTTALTLIGIGLFCGAMGKSAQFPLHVWLPDAMEGPTPVSALIHAATMVAAGVYLVGRIFPILTPDAKLFIAMIGLITLTMAALIALVQNDIKKVLAYSTLSQLGYMMLAMGIGSWVGALFHLITHAFFKALLFLGSGSVINAMHHEQRLSEYGGLIRRLPVTGVTFLIATLAIAGVGLFGIGLAGYYSKDLILAHAGAFAHIAGLEGRSAMQAFFIIPAVVAGLTSFYMARCWMLTFWGKPRNEHLFEHAAERPVMYVPLLFLAFATIVAGTGVMGVKEYLVSAIAEIERFSGSEESPYVGFHTAWNVAEPAQAMVMDAAELDAIVPEDEPASAAEAALEHGWHLVHQWIWLCWAGGLSLGFLMYVRGYVAANWLMRIAPLRWLHIWLTNRMYFDELYNGVFVAMVRGAAALAGWIDRVIVDGIVNGLAAITRAMARAAGLHDRWVIDGAVNGAATLAGRVGDLARTPQTGRIRVYVATAILVLALGLAGLVTAALVLP